MFDRLISRSDCCRADLLVNGTIDFDLVYDIFG